MAAARERSIADDVSTAAKLPSAGGRWWLQSWFPDWSGWYGAPQLSEEQTQDTETAVSENEKALGSRTFFPSPFRAVAQKLSTSCH